ncbi:hypothetical protein P3L10_030656 [Capsicum annuum]
MATTSVLVPIMIKYEDEWTSECQLYMQMKKKNIDINEYPLCITLVPVKFTAGELSNAIQIVKTNHFPDIEDDFSEEHLEDEPKPIIIDPFYWDIEQGQLHWDKNTITSVIKHYAIRHRFQFKVKRSSTSRGLKMIAVGWVTEDFISNKDIPDHCVWIKRYYLQCANEKCQWTFRSSSQKESEVFMVTRFFYVHTCAIADRMLSERYATSLTIAKIVKKKYLNLKSSFTAAEIMDKMRNSHGIRMNYKKAYRVKEKAIQLVRGFLRESYAKLPAYVYMVNTINLGLYTRLHKAEDNHFLYAFVALNASIKEWKYCMPTIVVDSTFLKSVYWGTMLCASMLDATGKILSLAYSITDSESDASWECSLCMHISDMEQHLRKIQEESEGAKGNVFSNGSMNARAIFTELGNKYNTIIRENLILSDKIKVMASTSRVYVVIDEIQKRSIVCMREKGVAAYNFRLMESHVLMLWKY